MNTPAHVVLSALILGRGSWKHSWLPITAGAVIPDLPMLAFYVYQRGVLGTPESIIWSDAYHRPDWQLLFNLFNSLPLLALAALISWRAGALRMLAFIASMILHCLADLPLHHDDAHAHFLPISGWKFESPGSYWDPRYHGRLLGGAEMLFVLGGAGVLLLRSRITAWRIVAAVTLSTYALLIAFAVIYWLSPST